MIVISKKKETESDMLELLKCPYCGNLPEIYLWSSGCYLCLCTNYACNFPYSIRNGKENAIRAWNEEVLRYEEIKKEAEE